MVGLGLSMGDTVRISDWDSRENNSSSTTATAKKVKQCAEDT